MAFSTIDDTTLNTSDSDVARHQIPWHQIPWHQIPWHDTAPGTAGYELNGILCLVRAEALQQGANDSDDVMYRGFDRIYWFIT
ncbi:MAG: hypothetical protein ACKVIQ_19810 [Acidimicrobiales bacterium]